MKSPVLINVKEISNRKDCNINVICTYSVDLRRKKETNKNYIANSTSIIIQASIHTQSLNEIIIQRGKISGKCGVTKSLLAFVG